MTTPDEPPPSAAWVLPPQPPPPPPPPGPTPSAAWGVSAPAGVWTAPGPAVPAAPRATVNGMAVASLVLGLCCWCFFIPGILAVIFGNLGLGAIRDSQGALKGRGLAIAGIVLGWISVAMLAGLAIAWLGYGISNL